MARTNREELDSKARKARNRRAGFFDGVKGGLDVAPEERHAMLRHIRTSLVWMKHQGCTM